MSRPLLLSLALIGARSTRPMDGYRLCVTPSYSRSLLANSRTRDCYGISLAQRVDVRDGDVLAYLGIASKTVEASLQNLSRYSRVFSEAFQFEFKLDDGSGTLNISAQHPSLSGYRQASEFRHSLIVLACRSFTGKRITPRAVHFIHQRRRGMGSFAEFFGCPVKFGQSHERIIFSRKELATPITSADHRLLAILRKHAEEILVRRPKRRPELIHRLERRLIELIPTGEARAKIVAAELGMSERTLVRRLGELGTSFAAIVDHLRHDLARKYLKQRDLSFTHIAFLLGYSNQSAFSSACRRWTGKTPRELRAA